MNQREKKFRAWDSEKKKWIYFGLPDLAISKPSRWHFVDIQNASQFTGLKDKNGKEIYEGDIVTHYDPTFGEKYEDRLKYKTIVDIFLPKTLSEERLGRLEVIDDIYENGELLK